MKGFEEKKRQKSLSELNTNVPSSSSSSISILFSLVGILRNDQIKEANYALKHKIFGLVSFHVLSQCL